MNTHIHNENSLIIIVNYNTSYDTIENLESLKQYLTTYYTIIIVDNASLDCNFKHLDKYIKKNSSSFNAIYLIRNEKNIGFAPAVNIGIKYANSENISYKYIWFLNNDTVLLNDTLSKLIKSYENIRETEKIGALGCVQYYYHDPQKIQAIAGGFDKKKAEFWNIQNIEDEEIAFVYGASFFTSKDVIQEVGFLCEDYFLYYEEIDFCERLKSKDYTFRVDKTISILHKHRTTIKKEPTDFGRFYLEKNKFLFYKKFYPHLIHLLLWVTVKRFFLKLKKRKFDTLLLKSLFWGMLGK